MVHFLKAEDFSQVGEVQAHVAGKGVNAMAASPDGTKIATGDTTRKICTWDTTSKEKIKMYADQTDKIYSLAFSPVSNELCSISQDRSLLVINLDDHKLKKIPICHQTAKPDKVTVSGTGRIFTTGDDCAIRVWQKVWDMTA